MTGARNRKAEAIFDRILIATAAFATLIAAGLALATILSPNPSPTFSGAEHLNLFSQPARYAARPAHVADPRGAGPDSGQVDPTPVGAIGAAAPQPPSAEREWRVHDVVGKQAWLIGPQGLRIVDIGADLGELGSVTGIGIEREGYVVTTTKTRIGPAR
ncbi:MAG: hypothetical protein IPL88_01300 [Rhizobiales bacterium]|nr:hypothetical protein [Hyphomicrobiales bacterium]